MLLRTISALLVGCTLVLAPLNATAQEKRGPSTSEERAKALSIARDNETNPFGPNAPEQRRWFVLWLVQVPDISVHACTLFDKLAKSGKKDSDLIFGQMVFSQAAFILQNPEKKDDRLAEYQAGVEGALRVYEVLVKANSKDRQPYLDDLIQRREAGTLAQFVAERASASCKN
jgi:hypothetical protein